ncbi:NAD(P)H-dependent flavin oxidoreductase [Pontibacillus yanchengensis]|uniref:Probable nitronate monooxygenase n=1 Tax=Pontibacillus yanchengensis Y32 TaxID=1385514 RepID=A0A0A2TFD8_9BACI|nr:nitronate monooxygenase [Pontibacillus yanchengensis]KGP74269.1 2-nitropropane dioxygenase [Pontibacillus yanchengensis Y32]
MKTKLPESIAQNLTLPVISAPMFLVSSPALVIESCKAGIIGSFPTLNARTEVDFEQWMDQITTELAEAKEADPSRKIAPWAVNLIVHRTNKRYETDLELIQKYEPPIVITSLGNPSAVVEIVHQYGGLVFSDVATIPHAKKAASTGVDGLILVASGAGGHAGPINSFAFAGAVREFWDGITILAGCISSGRDVLATQALGMDMAYIGTKFISAKESMASDDYKNMLVQSTVEDLINTDAFTGVHANYLKESITKSGINIDDLKSKGSADLSKLNQSDSKAWKDIWSAGQGVDQVHEVESVEEIVDGLEREYSEALQGFVAVGNS